MTKDSLGHRVRRARELAGLPDDVKLYGVWHAFGTRGIIAGCDIKTLSVLMGYTDTKITEHDAHIAGKRDFLATAMLQINQTKAIAATKCQRGFTSLRIVSDRRLADKLDRINVFRFPCRPEPHRIKWRDCILPRPCGGKNHHLDGGQNHRAPAEGELLPSDCGPAGTVAQPEK